MTIPSLNVSHKVMWSHCENDAVYCYDGTLMVGLTLQGLPFHCVPEDALNYATDTLAKLISLCDDETITLRLVHHRHKIEARSLPALPRNEFEEHVMKAWDDALSQKSFYQNDYALIISTNVLNFSKENSLRRAKGDSNITGTISQFNKLEQWLNKFSAKKEPEVPLRDAQLARKKSLFELRDDMISAGDLFLAKSLTDKEWPRWLYAFINAGDTEVMPTRNALNVKLAEHRIHVGNSVQFFSPIKNKMRYATCLSMVGYPDEAVEYLSLSWLNGIDSEFMMTNSAVFVPPNKIKDSLKLQQSLLESTNDEGDNAHHLAEARSSIVRNASQFFEHQHTITVFTDSLAELDNAVRDIFTGYRRHDFALRKETWFLNTVFWSQALGNDRRLERTQRVTSHVIAAMALPLQDVTVNNEYNHLGSGIMCLPTLGNGLHYLHLHETLLNKTNVPTAGTTLIIGPNGTGKTILQQMIALNVGRFNGSTIIFDRDYSQAPMVLMCDGVYHEVAPEKPSLFAPLQLPMTESNKQFIVSFLTELCLTEGEKENPRLQSDIEGALMSLLTVTEDAPHLRTLSQFATCLGAHFERHVEFAQFCKTPYEGSSGSYAFLFDNVEDKLSFDNPITGIDMTWTLSDKLMPPKVRNAILQYCFYRVESHFKNANKCVQVILEEAWQLFLDESWLNFLNEKIPTLRKNNIFFTFATQTPEAISSSECAKVIGGNYATFIGLSNPNANINDYGVLGLTENEVDIIKELPKHKRFAIIKHKNADRFSKAEVIKTDFSALGDILSVLQGGHKDFVAMQTFKKNYISTNIKQTVQDWKNFKEGRV